ncbi:long-chain fatty acid transport protein 4-like isoform X1 [Photinus pyralis]|uniref:Very long-chain fatty acid transport protein n=2 Tax=Photinus pyralis TaxID=7054 RepID=A0A1Y1MIY0_PHOPY|nr:long-chain fatty acid transport protein 4-like isoform X1 [Photinus pyralis]
MWLLAAVIAIITAFIAKNKRYRWLYIILKTYKRDFRVAIAFAKLRIKLWWWGKMQTSVPERWATIVKRHPNKVAFQFEGSSLTFLQVDEFSNQIANYFKSEGFTKGDNIALLLENSHEYPCIWLGLTKIGVVTALINTNLVNDPLNHSINVSNCKAIIFGSNHSNAIKQIQSKLVSVKKYQFHENVGKEEDIVKDCVDLRKALSTVTTKSPGTVQVSVKDPFLYIYTSGTTGLPKAAVISHVRFMFMATAFNYMSKMRSEDTIYNPLPLYHSAGGMIGMGQTVLHGLSVAIRKKFSASNYWSDCAKYNCTVAQYVGEMCRYILATPRKEPVKHSVRAIFGNGLKAQIWTEFVNTFEIKEVFEFYGATEGISNIINVDNTPGCVGFVPRYAGPIYPMTLLKCDQETGEPLRNSDGFCMECGINEPGLVISKINQRDPCQEFKGYADKKATNKKILQNVFKKGDAYFNSGDILERDELGNYFFKDRTGDTFRWKGENVSTSEVEGIISNILQLNDAVVYGVEIPNTEGRAGMAAVVDTNDSLNLEVLSNGLRNNLPTYSIPIFLRVLKEVPLTGTYKLKKIDLQRDGYDIKKISDQIYFYNAKLRKYEELTKDLMDKIRDGRVSV